MSGTLEDARTFVCVLPHVYERTVWMRLAAHCLHAHVCLRLGPCAVSRVRAVRDTTYQKLFRAMQTRDEREYATSVKMLQLLHPADDDGDGAVPRIAA